MHVFPSGGAAWGRMAVCLGLVWMTGMAGAQERVYRCGNEYTNNPAMARDRNCKLLQGGNVTVIEGTRPSGAAARPVPSPSVSSGASLGPRVDAAEQRARDTDSRAILEAELKRAEARQAELVKEYNNGEPEKQGGEARNYQKYLDRVAELKASMARNESDIAGIRRELARMNPPAASPR